MSRLLRPPQQNSSLTDKDGKPTSHHYRWMDGVTETISQVNDTLYNSTSALNTSINTTNTNVTNLTTRVTALESKSGLTQGTIRTFTGNAAASHTFSNIPSTVKRIVVCLNNCVCNTASNAIVLRLGTAGGIDSLATYDHSMTLVSSNGDVWSQGSATSQHFFITRTQTISSEASATLHNTTGNTWHYLGNSITQSPISTLTPNWLGISIGSKSLSGVLTSVTILSSGGANITAGTVNIFYE